MKVNTDGYGGQRIRESVRIRTNDPIRPWFSVGVTGMVEKFVDIRPERVQLAGPAGQPIFAEVTLYPRQDYPFSIRQLGAKNGRFIKYELVRQCSDEDNRCVIRIENTRKKKGRYIDALYVHTTSRMRPVIPIYVMGLIR